MAMWHKFDRQKYKNRYRNSDEGVVIRVRIPMGREILGILEQRLGSCRVRVRCMDGRSRICRVPGRLKKKLWVKEGDVLLIEPWEFEGDEKGDVIFKYTRNQVDLLKKKGLMNEIEELEEF